METRTVVWAENPVWADANHTLITLKVTFAELPHLSGIAFAAAAHDVEPHGVDLFERAVAGEFGDIAPFSAPQSGPLTIMQPRLPK